MANEIEFIIRGVDKFSSTMGKVDSSLAKTAKGIAKVAAVALAAAGGTFYLVKKFADMQAETYELAKSLNVTTEALSTWRYVAEQSGVPAEKLDKLFIRMSASLGEAHQGMGASSQALRDLGLSARQLAGLSIDKQFETIVAAIGNAKDETTRMNAAFKIFGQREGAAVLKIVKDGSKDFQALAADARFLGIVISAQAGANAKLFGDELLRVGQAVKGAGFAMSNEMIPVLTGMAREFANFIARNREFFQSLGRGAITAVITVIAVFQLMWEKIVDIWNGVKARFESFLKILGLEPKDIWAGLDKTLKVFVEFGRFLGTIFSSTWSIVWGTFSEYAGAAWHNVKAIFSGNLDEVIPLDKIFKNIADKAQVHIDRMREGWDTLNKNMADSSRTGMDSLKEAFGDTGMGSAIDSIISRVDALREKFTTTAEVAKETTTTTGVHIKTFWEALSEEINKWTITNKTLAETYAVETAAIITNTVGTTSQMIADAIVNGENLSKVFQNIVKQVASSIIAMFIKVQLQRMVLALFNMKATGAEASSQLAAGLAQVYTNSFASAAAIPVVGWAMAPGVAAANAAIAAAGATASAAAGSGLGAGFATGGLAGVAHGGLESVPREGTFLLNKGERVLSPNQNQDLTNFLDGGDSGAVTIENLTISILPNATNAEALLNLRETEWNNLVAGPIIKSLNTLRRRGVKPESDELRRG